MKLIRYLPLLVISIISCKEQNIKHVDYYPDKSKSFEPKTIRTGQHLLNIPWVDPALLASVKGC